MYNEKKIYKVVQYENEKNPFILFVTTRNAPSVTLYLTTTYRSHTCVLNTEN